MPYRLNEAHWDKIPKAKYRVTNWPDCDRGLVERSGSCFWIDEAVIEDWIAPWRKGPGGQRRCSNTAIVATLTSGSVNQSAAYPIVDGNHNASAGKATSSAILRMSASTKGMAPSMIRVIG